MNPPLYTLAEMVPSEIGTKAHLRLTGQVEATTGQRGRFACSEAPSPHSIEKGVPGELRWNAGCSTF